MAGLFGTGLFGATMKYVPSLKGILTAGNAAGKVGTSLAGQNILQEAQNIAPVDTGAYRASLYTEEGSGAEPSVIVASDIEYAVYLEFGTSDTPTFATLRQASETAGI